jgi:hypothetical protein
MIPVERYYAFVKKLVNAFEEVKLDYAFTGALAVSFYGVPRTTTDVDVIIADANKPDSKKKIAVALNWAGLQVDERKIESAFTSGYNIATFKSKTTPFTVDIIILEEKLDKNSGKIDNVETFFQSPEGLVASKLRMIKASLAPERVAKDKEDVKAILTFTKLNIDKVRKQAQKDKTLEILNALTA